jgi:hypothetical protein
MGRFFEARFWGANLYSRYIYGSIMAIFVGDYFAAWYAGVPRQKDPNIAWPWWREQMSKIATGEIPANTPGYALVQWRNEAEERWMGTLDVEAINKERQERRVRYYTSKGMPLPAAPTGV